MRSTADLLQEYQAKIAALEWMVGRQALEIERPMGALTHAPRPRRANTSIVTGPGGARPGARYHGRTNHKQQALEVAALRAATPAEMAHFIQINQPSGSQ